MLFFIILIFAIAAAGGAYLLTHVLKNQMVPSKVALIHGGVAAFALVLLLIYCFSHVSAPMTSLLVFILVACGGIYMGVRGMQGKGTPKLIALGHGTFAVIAFIMLLMFALRG